MKKTIPIIHQLARTGGTIIGRCIGSMRGVTLLSEINPRGNQVDRILDPIYQGEHWFKLLTPQQAQNLRSKDANLSEIIEVLYDEAKARDNQLLIRDWSHVDYFDWPVPSPPMEMSLERALHTDFNIRSICVVRHPITQWMSWNRYQPQQPISVTDFLAAYLRFAERAFEIGFVRYEDFCKKPDETLQTMCGSLGIEYDHDYRNNWQPYLPISGDDYVYESEEKIKQIPEFKLQKNMLDHFLARDEYFYATSLFNYAPFGERLFDPKLETSDPSPTWIAQMGSTSVSRKKNRLRPSGLREAAAFSRRPEINQEQKRDLLLKAIKDFPHENGRVYLFDPSVLNEIGHHFSLVNALKEEAESLGKQCIILANNQIKDELSSLDAFAYFGIMGFGSNNNRDENDNYHISVAENQEFTKYLAELSTIDFHPDDFVFFPTVTPNLILAIVSWALSFQAKRRPKIGLCLMLPPDWHSILRASNKQKQIYAAAFSLLGDQSSMKNIVFTTETAGLAKLYRDEYGIDAVALPTPTFGLQAEKGIGNAPQSEPSSQILISSIGHARPEKGTHFLPEIHEFLTKSGHDFILNVQLTGYDEGYLLDIAGKLGNFNNVRLYYEPLDRADFSTMIAESDIMVLSYDPLAYHNRGSALFNECRWFGVPVVAPGDTDIGEEVEKLKMGTLFTNWNAICIAEALEQAIQQLSDLKSKATDTQSAYIAKEGYLSTIMKNFDP